MRSLLLLSVPPSGGDPCTVCRGGCPCADGAPGCGHYGCRGRAPLSCPTAVASRAATERQRAVYAARRAAWRTPPPLLRVP